MLRAITHYIENLQIFHKIFENSDLESISPCIIVKTIITLFTLYAKKMSQLTVQPKNVSETSQQHSSVLLSPKLLTFAVTISLS